jgi:hypothetical protein
MDTPGGGDNASSESPGRTTDFYVKIENEDGAEGGDSNPDTLAGTRPWNRWERLALSRPVALRRHKSQSTQGFTAREPLGPLRLRTTQVAERGSASGTRSGASAALVPTSTLTAEPDPPLRPNVPGPGYTRHHPAALSVQAAS